MKPPNPSWPHVFAGYRFAVLGLGQNGLPVALALRQMGAEITAWDDDATKREAASASGVALALPSAMPALDGLILSPGIPHHLPAPHPQAAAAIARNIPILSDAELLFQAVRRAGSRARFAGITGTNGKSTTTALLAHILAKAAIPVAAGGNLGPAALALPLLPDHGIYVLEMSSYMLERIASMRFDAAAMLNITNDHLDRHGNMAGYVAAKAAIFARQQAGDVAVVGIDDAPSRAMAAALSQGSARLVRISGGRSADIFAENHILRDEAGIIANLASAPALRGTHNAQNAAAAAALALALDIPRDQLAPAFTSFPGLPHRQKIVATIAGIDFVDDSKATNADAASRALASFDRVIWIAGGIAKAGHDEQGGIEPLRPWFHRIAFALLIGRDAAMFANTLRDAGVPCEITETLDRAVRSSLALARRHNAATILLSPAAASFDQFANYAERGNRFAEHALALAVPQEAN